jgi:E3 ubiquitin-protein ligase DOA10
MQSAEGSMQSAEGNEDNEELCRFCFDEGTDDDPLLTPCLCKGDQ